MTDSPIERAARALDDSMADAFALSNEGRGPYPQDFRDGVLAVLRAIREPSEAMLKPGGDENAYFNFHREDNAAAIWRQMIDTLIAEAE